MGYIFHKIRGILGKIMGYIMVYNWQYFYYIGYIKQQLREILGKIMECLRKIIGYIWQILLDIFAEIMGYIRKNYGMYWAKTLEYIGLTIGNFMGCIWPKSWVILWDILVKNYWIYLAKLWDILVHWIY